MRLLKNLQLFLCPAKIVCDRSQELGEMDRIISAADGMREVLARILLEVNDGANKNTGRDGVTAEQILKLGILRKRHNQSYRELSEASLDSLSMRQFLNLAPGCGLSKSAIHRNLKKVSDATWEKANSCLIQYALANGYENGAAVRGDTTSVETNIHYPTDANLMNDVVRVLCRKMCEARNLIGESGAEFIDHRRRAKSKLFTINNARGEAKKRPQYLELIRVTRSTIDDAKLVLSALISFSSTDIFLECLVEEVRKELKNYIPLAEIVHSQAYRRVVKKEAVDASEKIVSIFEEHTDIIVKGHRDVVFGHKIMLTTGASGMLLTLKTIEGNPKDSTLVPGVLNDLSALLGQMPEALAFDGCFASTANRNLAKKAGVQELTFSKNGSLDLSTLVSSSKMNRVLRNFRAGIEGCISFFKRCFQVSRIVDRTKESFRAALQLSGFAYNLTLLARMSLARAAG